MPRLCSVLTIVIAAAGAATAAPPTPADARQKQEASPATQYRASPAQYKSKRAGRRQTIIRDRSLFGPPPLPPSSTERNYYGPAPGIQPPMERVPLPAPLSPPPIRNP